MQTKEQLAKRSTTMNAETKRSFLQNKLYLRFESRSTYLPTLVALALAWEQPSMPHSNIEEIAATTALEEGWAIDLLADMPLVGSDRVVLFN